MKKFTCLVRKVKNLLCIFGQRMTKNKVFTDKWLSKLATEEEPLDLVLRMVKLGGVVNARNAANRFITDAPDSRLGLAMRLFRARLYESGRLGVNCDAEAFDDFYYVACSEFEFRTEAMIGCARILYKSNSTNDVSKAMNFCKRAIKLDSNVRAMMLLGYGYEHSVANYQLANKWYLKAFTHGSPWGLRSYSTVQWKRRKFVASTSAFVIVLILGLLMVPKVLWHGMRDPFA